MVAVTVILAAVIGSYVFGMPMSIQKAKLMGSSVQMEMSQGLILLSYHGGPDDISLAAINITAPNGSVWYTSSSDGALTIKYGDFACTCQTSGWCHDEIISGS